MISYEEALKLVDDNVSTLGKTEVKLNEMAGCYLAEDVIATMQSPQFDNSAVDGYGIKTADLTSASETSPKHLKLLSTIAAGSPKELQISAGEAVKIFTGARVPSSCEAVVMREYCREENGHVIIECSAQQGENIRRAGNEYKKGETVLESGIKATPPVIALLASLGHVKFSVFKKPRVALVVTGDELVEPGNPLKDGQIYDSNAYGLSAALNSMGISDCKSFIARDTREETREAFEKALADNDMVISSGGVSVGDHDYVKETLEALGFTTVFWRIAIKPGKPVYFGILDGKGGGRKYVFGLPGNPVSVLVTFHQIVKPALRKLAGGPFFRDETLRIPVGSALKKRPGRLDFVRGTLKRNPNGETAAIPTRGQESHMLSGLAKAQVMLHFDADLETLNTGDPININFIDWND
ncbi:MAG TPA: molybdopterin molybdotransferase MoeA [Candidatus Melainabacteria bacterium]|nr:molybdopterin molybdotransferase MoeA [Candidatus Melainabacteria bacterium]HIN66553.1 molybdopterin molybdenumtransferase MoeA [Candidatus Obscuribacterales bacterium]